MVKVFINAVQKIRMDNGMYHFSLGENGPSVNGDVVFEEAGSFIMNAEDASGLLAYMMESLGQEHAIHSKKKEVLTTDHKLTAQKGKKKKLASSS
tara:strand:+ start:477 stop:761 length:285 start_codon:yes stop_codon:yes gene_type:complete